MSDFYREAYGSGREAPKPAGGGPAFPCNEHTAVKVGMTLRDYFAAKAMQALLSNPGKCDMLIRLLAADAYEYADAMLKARNE